jgi:hypothetical protein
MSYTNTLVQRSARPPRWPRFNRWFGRLALGILKSLTTQWSVTVLYGGDPMDVLANRLDKKLQGWASEVAEQVRCEVVELIELADRGLLDIARSRRVEQEVLDLIDESKCR